LRFAAIVPLFWLALLFSCGDSAPPERILGRAVTGARELNLLADLHPRSAVKGKTRFGEPVEILKVRRRFCFVKARSGVEGWIDGRDLIREQDMQAIQQLTASYREQPSMGRVQTFEALNVHAWPNRNAPSFDQIATGEEADILGHRVAQRIPFEPLALPKPPPRKRATKKGSADAAIPPPPAPRPPKPPEDWRDLSITPGSMASGDAPLASSGTKQTVRNLYLLQQRKTVTGPIMDDWTLIRTQRGNVGWALSRLLIVRLPEELLLPTRRQRITASVTLGEAVNAKGETRPHLLLATRLEPNQSFQFDAFQVWEYNARRRRYESIYTERDLRGYLPLVVNGLQEKRPEFIVVVEDEEGRCFRRRYVKDGARVRYEDQAQVDRPRQPSAPNEVPPLELPGDIEDDGENSWWGKLRRQIFGK
jgi:hypothetical protein